MKKIIDVIDLRSDTVTLPTKEMSEAIKQAELGDNYCERRRPRGVRCNRANCLPRKERALDHSH